MKNASTSPKKRMIDILTIEEIEDYLIFFADLVDEIGPIAQPWLERFEREYEQATKPKEADRIRQLITEKRAARGASP
ncbi:hypothetical protein [Neorhizobium galegae]|uniref:hypothetical protein n=1 Tax=Neorhizobium galegae TaxID=399 RepID=UPI002104870B|nr:hypothetical protein [Neorhizobium galegae]MCQ1850387.1 hypothetical protein [Neorhizobium galegae]